MASLQQLHEEGDRGFREMLICYPDRDIEIEASPEKVLNYIHQEREKAYKAGIELVENMVVRNDIAYMFPATQKRFIEDITNLKALKGEK